MYLLNILAQKSKSYPKAGVLPVSCEGGFVGAEAAMPVTVVVVVVALEAAVVAVVAAVVALEGKHCEYQSFE